MSGEVNMIPTPRKFRGVGGVGGTVQANSSGASLETFSGEAQLRNHPIQKLHISSIDAYVVTHTLCKSCNNVVLCGYQLSKG